MPLTFFSLEGPYSSTCGYCGEPGSRSTSESSHSYGVYPIYSMLSCSIYMDMINRGWRRSGIYLYKPDMKRTCCPQYTIRLDALEFSPTRSQRQVTNRWSRFVLEGDQPTNSTNVDGPGSVQGKGKTKLPPFDLVTAIHSSESDFILDDTPGQPEHRFEVTLEPSTFSDEKFNLYKGYQHNIHHEEEERSPTGFQNFLVGSPLLEEPIPYPSPPPPHLPKNYGSYHQCYRIDGELFAVAVLDILPGCVSSVYYMYDKKWERFSLGKISALREAALAREIHDAGIPSMNALYMGYYVHSCPKMRYKGDFAPSYLLDPEEYTWFPFKECTPLLDKHRYACFSKPENSLDDDPGPEDVPDFPPEALTDINILDSVDMDTRTAKVASVSESWHWQHPEIKKLIVGGINTLGTEVAQEVTLVVDV